jgi:hypothetical protein
MTNMEDVYKDISFIIDKIGQLGVFPPLVWVWTWDVSKSMLNNFREDEDYKVTMTDEEVWKLFWEQADENGFTLEYGVEDLDEHVSDWLIKIGAVELVEEEEDEDE